MAYYFSILFSEVKTKQVTKSLGHICIHQNVCIDFNQPVSGDKSVKHFTIFKIRVSGVYYICYIMLTHIDIGSHLALRINYPEVIRGRGTLGHE